jgi:trigger factor
METSVKDIGPCKKEIVVVVPADTVTKELTEAFKRLTSQVVLPGFRPGKVPMSILEKRFGEDICHSVAGDLAKTAFERAIADSKFTVVSEPKLLTEHLHAHKGESMTVSFEVEIQPEFDVAGYKDLEVERVVEPVEDRHVDAVVESLRKSRAEWEPVAEGGYAEGDRVTANVKAFVDGALIHDASDEEIANENVARIFGFDVDGFAEALRGAVPGKTLELEGRVGALSDKEALVGAKATLAVTPVSVTRAKLHEADDALAESAGKKTMLEFRAEVRSKLEARHAEDADRKVEDALIDKILAANPFDMPMGPIQRSIASRLERASLELAIRGKTASEAVEAVEKRREDIAKAVERDARAWLVVEKIAKKEKIFALEDDVAREYERIAREGGHTPSEVRRYYEDKDLTGELRAEILEKKVREYLRSRGKVVDRAASAAGGA